MSFSPTTLTWLVGTLGIIALLAAAAVRFVRVTARTGWTEAVRSAMLLVLLAGLVAYALPYVLAASSIETAVEGAAVCLYSVLLTISIQAPTVDAAEIAHNALDAGGFVWLASLYAFVLNVLSIAMPFVVVSTAINSLRGRLRGMRFHHYRRHHEVAYVLSGMDHRQVALARDILANRSLAAHYDASKPAAAKADRPTSSDLRPLVVFCNVTDQVRDDNSALIEALRDQGKGDVSFEQSSPEDLLGLLCDFRGVHLFAFGDDHAENVETTATLITRICELAAQRTEGMPKDEATRAAQQFALRFSVYCSHANHDDELVFDSLAQRDPTQDELPETADMTETQAKAFYDRMQAARSRIEVRLVSFAQERIFNVLTSHPLFSVLDPVDVRQNVHAPQQLWVVVAGLGANGLAALRTAYWMGRLYGVSLHLLGIDQRANQIREDLLASSPEMMEELDAEGQPVVRLVQARALTPEFSEALGNLPADARVYTLVTMGEDQLNLSVALDCRRTFDLLVLRGTLQDPGPARRPMVLPLIYARETFNAAERMASDRNETFDIIPFGSTAETFSFSAIVADPWEQYALGMNAAYDEVWAADDGKLRGSEVRLSYDKTLLHYNAYEIKKFSSRTCTRHIPYRLWLLGLDPARHIADDGQFARHGLTNGSYLRALGISAREADLLLRPCQATSDPLQFRTQLDELQMRFPVVMRLAQLEHERWVAFYRSEGWRDLPIFERDRLVDMGIIARPQRAGAQPGHQSPKLRLHSYLCDHDTLLDRGVALGDDPYVYDRAAIVETQRILEGTLFA